MLIKVSVIWRFLLNTHAPLHYGIHQKGWKKVKIKKESDIGMLNN